MILEEITGDVKLTLNGKPLTLGSSIEDSQYSLVSAVGKGKATFRVDSSCTVDIKGVEATEAAAAPVVEEPTPAPVEAATVAEVVAPVVETPSATAEEENTKK